MAFVIQNIETGKFVKHTGKQDDYPFVEVDRQEDAEQYSNFPHASYVATWYVDYFYDWRVIDTETGKTYIRNDRKQSPIGPRFVPEPPAGAMHV
jgi:hypothetical protein